MPRPIFAHKLHLTRVGQAAAVVTTEASPPGGERWYGLHEQTNIGVGTSSFGMLALTANGTASALVDATGAYINYLSSTAASSLAGWTNTSTDIVEPQILPELIVVLKTGAAASDIANLRIWVGIQSGAGALGTDTPGASGVSTLLFRYSTPAGDTTWQATSADGASDTVADTGVVVAVDTRYVMRIKVVSTTSVEYYIDDVLVATLTTTLPAATTGLRPRAHTVNALVGTARNLRLRKYYIDAL